MNAGISFGMDTYFLGRFSGVHCLHAIVSVDPQQLQRDSTNIYSLGVIGYVQPLVCVAVFKSEETPYLRDRVVHGTVSKLCVFNKFLYL
jgi:hypothetical protein